MKGPGGRRGSVQTARALCPNSRAHSKICVTAECAEAAGYTAGFCSTQPDSLQPSRRRKEVGAKKETMPLLCVHLLNKNSFMTI